ncbi:ABC transporter substrate-binding protein [Skermania piniformis]|uniref:ABC transporter substrate-binding protein n=1 Tax=Skermania pinensis TaxID=39122 RepID=A0ABX8SDM0_9ACTN|nr:ABC transporter substrate-binding protein [Skermania piniformis]
MNRKPSADGSWDEVLPCVVLDTVARHPPSVNRFGPTVSTGHRHLVRSGVVRARVLTTATALAATALLGTAVLAGCGGSSNGTDEPNQVVRTTTAIAGAGIVGIDRDTSTACPSPTAPETADPQRIVALSTQALDTACALGLWERVVGAAVDDGATGRPGYLGSGIATIPGVGSPDAPDAAKIGELRPDLILGGNEPAGGGAADPLQAIAPTIFVRAGDDWEQQVRTLGGALGRPNATAAALDDYRQAARTAGGDLFAGQTQASVVRFTDSGGTVAGTDGFAGRVLADVGVQRPPAQRGASFPLDTDDPAAAEGDVVYVSFAGPAGEEHGADVMQSDGWKKLSAAHDKRVWSVADEIWHGSGIVAARALVTDLRDSLNYYGS